jgi:hypothetical protein
MLNLSMSQELGDRVQQILTQELDKRMNEIISGDVKQEFTRRAILKFIGKDTYQFGDITKSIMLGVSKKNEIVIGTRMKQELEEWDAAHPLSENDDSDDDSLAGKNKKKSSN